ncbi:hypothetical protein EJB05_15174, partial [Eragrostis curvula]
LRRRGPNAAGGGAGVANHGVDPSLLAEAYRCLDAFYARPLAEKQRAQRRPGESYGYASSFTGRFDCKLPWMETLSFHHSAAPGGERAVVDYFVAVLGEEYRHMGYGGVPGVQRRDDPPGAGRDGGAGCDAGPGRPRRAARLLLRQRLGDASEPVPAVPAAAPGTGHGPAPRPDVGDAAAPGRRRRPAGARRRRRGAPSGPVPTPSSSTSATPSPRSPTAATPAASTAPSSTAPPRAAPSSLTFFLNPQLDRVVRPPPALLAADPDRPRAFPDFTWREFLEFTQKRYRSNENTLEAFVAWIKAGRGKGHEEK